MESFEIFCNKIKNSVYFVGWLHKVELFNFTDTSKNQRAGLMHLKHARRGEVELLGPGTRETMRPFSTLCKDTEQNFKNPKIRRIRFRLKINLECFLYVLQNSNEQQDGVKSITWAGLNKVDGTWRIDRTKSREVSHVFPSFANIQKDMTA